MKENYSYQQFVDYVRDNIYDCLPEEERGNKIHIRPFEKIGSSYLAMCMDSKPFVGRAIVNLDDFYQLYKNQVPLEELMEQMAGLLTKTFPNFNTAAVSKDYDVVRNQLFIRLSNRVWNKDLLEKVPYLERDGLAITCHLLFSKPDDENLMSCIVTNEIMERYGVTQKQLFSDAMENGQRLFPERIQKMEINWVEQKKPLEYLVVTNKQGINGAAALFYPGVLERLGEQFPGGFYLIPTSIHEFILEFEQRGLPLETMEESLKGTNQRVTYSKDQLSNEVYHYDPSRACFERAKTYQKRFMN